MPGASDVPHRERLVRCLAALGTDPDHLLGYVVLAGGASGATTYRLRFPPGDLVLKVVRPGSPGHLLERARREVLFYRHLAPAVRIPVPRVIASRGDEAVGVCLLLEAYAPSPAPAAWTADRYLEAAEHLGRLHAASWGRGHELSTYGWLRRAEDLAGDTRRAYTYWERLRAGGRFARVLTPERYAWILGLLGRVHEVGVGPAAFPVTLRHGDFHSDNLLVDPGGGLVLADWQEVGPGRGPEDLSFFLQRARFAGGTVPEEGMLRAYRRSLAAHAGVAVALADIRRVVEASELRTRLLHWPAFLAEAPEGQVADLLARIQILAAGRRSAPESGW